MRTVKRPQRDERGVTMVFAAIALVALLAVIGLAIDGGNAFTDRRQTQNASDAAALAGASALNSFLAGSGVSTDIYAAVQNSIQSNHVNGSFTCQLIDASYSTAPSDQRASHILGNCPPPGSDLDDSVIPAGANGVLVQTSDTQNTSFVRVVGASNFTAKSLAAANIEALKNGSSPFLVCAVDNSDSHSGHAGLQNPPDPPLLVTTDGTNYTINSGAIGHSYEIHGPPGHGFYATCGLGASWKGLAGSGTYPIPGFWPTLPGDRSGPVANELAGEPGCSGQNTTSLTLPCDILLPLCYSTSGGAGAGQLYCVALAKFTLTSSGPGGSANTQFATFDGGSVPASSGQGGGVPQPNQARIVKLTL
jgi:hypothetical protein